MSVWVDPLPRTIRCGTSRHAPTAHSVELVFDHERNIHVCPGGAKRSSTCNIDQNHIVYYTAWASATGHPRAQAKLCAGPNSIFGLS